jgi:hypothetical protein
VEPGNARLSSTITERPCLAKVAAQTAPADPPPMTTASRVVSAPWRVSLLASRVCRHTGSDQMEPADDVDGTTKLELAKRRSACRRLSNPGFRQVTLDEYRQCVQCCFPAWTHCQVIGLQLLKPGARITISWRDRGRDHRCRRPPAQIPACGITALGSCLGFWRRTVCRGTDASGGRVVAIESRCGSSVSR